MTKYLIDSFACRLTILCGPFGTGKTEVGIGLSEALAEDLAGVGEPPNLVDLDVVIPYFRSRDVAHRLKEKGVRAVFPNGEVAFSDLPAIPPTVFSSMRAAAKGEQTTIVDLGGEGQGATVLASLREALTDAPHWDMLFVLNPYRPRSGTVEAVREVLEEIETACRIKVSGLIANPHLKQQTSREVLECGMASCDKMARELELPFRLRCVAAGLVGEVGCFGPEPVLHLSLALLLPFEL